MANNFFLKNQASREQKARAKQRKQVEREYAKTHEETITVVEPANRHEMRLTHKGRFELGSNGELTQKGKTDRLSYRYNRGMIIVGVLTVVAYVTFFVLP
ncbi:hypothetical protein [Fructobacillus parabroussonetiae]|uniref:Uncharacterized protein n=1 Tax=Fructobacillus parabroussonetiae TaxID=2713174 RepID=A0ABS5QVD2_9LACO|nr:hypothetical protein [Fructobacillus parabroussonetiae]MBS9337163.1 hypothetical protein [Fructobacillus parabroussonetiae]MCK8617153.1 hypothetical protein [Fructobacillus parabroussonetiae]